MSTAPTNLDNISSVSIRPEVRSEAENQWVSFQPYLLSKGYQLRPRYQPDWVPSWKATGANPLSCEDSANSMPLRILDGTRVEDQAQVVIKMLAPSDVDREGEEELQILRHFSSPPFNNSPANHVVPCLDSFPIPGVEGGTFFVMPLLSRYANPPFADLSEIHDFLNQLFEGLEFLHENGVVHWYLFVLIVLRLLLTFTPPSDIASANIMMDRRPLYDEPFHPYYQHRSLDGKRLVWPKYLRSEKPVRYYYIDFGYAKWFRDPETPRILVGTHAREAAPEQKSGRPYDPFKADVYQLGALIRRDLIPQHNPLSFLLPLAREMTNSDPDRRPTLNSARYIMNTHFAGLYGWQTRWPIIPPNTPFRRRCALIWEGLTTEVILFLKKILSLFFCVAH
ncbi:hypothetical protein FRC08_008811 [Ceratobasidium sp. 394]|nr:hypothetical protein FRC08_008811 [Ceratobasidium sp. 394]